MRADSYARYRLTARRPASSAAVEHWWAEGPDGPAEVYLGPEMLVRRARALPVWGPFAGILTGRDGLRSYVVVRGRLSRSVDDLRDLLSPGACVAFAWHLAAALAEIHDRGGAHGALHPGWTGVDAEGRLTIRPALTAAVRSDPDSEATAQSTDCIQLASILEALHLERLDEPGLQLLMRGISRERSRLRLQPGRAVRQSLSYLLHRHPDWSAALVDTLGGDWQTERMPRAVALLPVEAPRPWDDTGVHIPRVGAPGPGVAATASVDLSAAPQAAVRPPSVATLSMPAEPPTEPPPSAISVQTARPVAAVPAAAPVAVPPAVAVQPAPAVESEGAGLQVRIRRSEEPAAPPEKTLPPVPPPVMASIEAPQDEPSELPAEPAPAEAIAAVEAPVEPAAVEPSPAPVVDDAPATDTEVEEGPTGLTEVPEGLQGLMLPRGEPDGEPPSYDSSPAPERADPDPVEAEPEPVVVPPKARERVVVVSSAAPVSDISSEEDYFEDDEQTAVTRVPEPVREALKRLEAGRNRNLAAAPPVSEPPPEADAAPTSATGAAPEPDVPARQPAPVAPPGPAHDANAPRWAGVRGVTGDASRDAELGSGKWEETARPLDELRKEMGAEPVRPMEEIDPSRGNWPMLVVAVVALIALIALWVYTQSVSG